MWILSALALAAPPTIRDPATAEALKGDHALSLQWIGTDQLGKAAVTVGTDGVWLLGGSQDKGTDHLRISGVIVSVDERSFTFEGTIETQVSYIAGGAVCPRTGTFTFTQKGSRHYWRLQQMDNPCEGVTDYVDIYLR